MSVTYGHATIMRAEVWCGGQPPSLNDGRPVYPALLLSPNKMFHGHAAVNAQEYSLVVKPPQSMVAALCVPTTSILSTLPCFLIMW